MTDWQEVEPKNSNPYESPEAADAPVAEEFVMARMHRIPFKTVVVLAACVGFAVGATMGASILVVSFFHDIDANLPPELGSHELRGVPLGLASLFVLPLYYALVLAIIAVIAYWPFRLVSNLACRWICLPVVVERITK